jgi:hypothetical protein
MNALPTTRFTAGPLPVAAAAPRRPLDGPAVVHRRSGPSTSAGERGTGQPRACPRPPDT